VGNKWQVNLPASRIDFKCLFISLMSACEMKPADKKELVSKVGKELVAKHGKKKYYEPKQVRRATLDSGYGIDVVCWAHCVFLSPEAFVFIHEAAGEVCDQAVMKAEVLGGLVGSGGFQLLDIGLSWLEWPDVDLPDLFDWF
jgi:hypothetical protein